jgi:endonuclease/exonuclease/phosphatase family metal-dependent hydrolase
MKKNGHPARRKWLLIAGIAYSLFFLTCCLTPYFEPSGFFLFTYATILFPYCLMGFIIWLLLALIFLRKYFPFFLLLLIPAWKNTGNVISFHSGKKLSYKKSPGQLRLLSWNVNNFLYGNFKINGFLEKQSEMLHFIKTTDADILCFQDYSEVPAFFGKANIAYIRDSLGYPYYYFSNDCNSYGTIIFSRLPVLDSGHIKYPGKADPESLAFISVPFQKDTLRIFNTHLHSMYLHSNKLTQANIGYMELVKQDTSFLFHSSRFTRLQYFDRLHVAQAKLVKEQLNKTNTPYIFCADLNSVPSGYVYQYIKQGLNDAFLQAGTGLGGTYHRFSLTLRIDVVFMSKRLTATQYFSPRLDLSDHYPILTDIQLRN